MSDTPFKIEKGVPLPSEQRGRPEKYLWLELEVGDSFAMNELAPSTAYNNARYASVKYQPRKFKVHKTADGYRCWRVA